jgi:hypothetical protein
VRTQVVIPSFDSLGRVLAAGDPRVWQALLIAHVADDLGRCRVCRRSSGPADVWPCRLWLVADIARRSVET